MQVSSAPEAGLMEQANRDEITRELKAHPRRRD